MHLITDEYFIDSLLAELHRAREKFPLSPKTRTLTALTEEVGEVAAAIFDLHDGKLHSWKPVWEEAVQVAAMAMRLAVEGDPSLGVPNHVNTSSMS